MIPLRASIYIIAGKLSMGGKNTTFIEERMEVYYGGKPSNDIG
jgi:hypothetical protein